MLTRKPSPELGDGLAHGQQMLRRCAPPKKRINRPNGRCNHSAGFGFFRCVYAEVWLDVSAEEGGVCLSGRLGSSERTDPQAVSLIAREPCDCGEQWNPAVTRVHGSVNQVASSSGSRGWAIVQTAGGLALDHATSGHWVGLKGPASWWCLWLANMIQSFVGPFGPFHRRALCSPDLYRHKLCQRWRNGSII